LKMVAEAGRQAGRPGRVGTHLVHHPWHVILKYQLHIVGCAGGHIRAQLGPGRPIKAVHHRLLRAALLILQAGQGRAGRAGRRADK